MRGFGVSSWPGWRDLAALQHSAALISPAIPAAASRWPMLVFTEPITSGAAGGAPGAEHAPSAPTSIGSPSGGAGAVGLDVADSLGATPASAQRRADHRLLRRAVRRGQAVLRPSWLTAVPRITAQDAIAVAVRRRRAA